MMSQIKNELNNLCNLRTRAFHKKNFHNTNIDQNLKPFLKIMRNNKITHNIVSSSALLFQNLSVIRERGRKL